jgi:squalene cyclase
MNVGELENLVEEVRLDTAECPDVLINNAFTLILFCPLTPRAEAWVAEHVQSEATWHGNALVVEPRYAWGLVEGMKDAGLLLA